MKAAVIYESMYGNTHKIAQPRMNRTIGGTTKIGAQAFTKLTYLLSFPKIISARSDDAIRTRLAR